MEQSGFLPHSPEQATRVRDLEARVAELEEECARAAEGLEDRVAERTAALAASEQALRVREQDLSRAQAVAQTGSWRLNVRHNALLWSDETYRIFQVPIGAPLTYEAFLAAVHPDDREYVDRCWSAALRGEPYAIEHRIVVGGETRWVRETAELEFDADGSLAGGFGTVQDITERKRAAEELRASEERLKLFVEHTPAAVAMLDRQMRYLVVSRRWLSDYRLDDKEIIGRSHYDVFPEVPERWKQVHQRCLAGAVERADEDPFPRSDGTTDWVHWEVRPWRDSAGEIGGLMLLSEVVTERKLAREAMRRYELLADNSRDIILFMRHDDGRILEANAAAAHAYGYSREELLRLSIHQLRADAAQAEGVGQMIEADERGVRFEAVHRRRDGREFPVEVSSQSATIGQMQLLISVVRDITDRKHAEAALRDSEERYRALSEELRRADRNKNEFLAVLSHELRNPLAPIRNSLYILDRAAPDSPSARRAKEIIDRQIGQLTRLVDDLLDVTRISRNKIRLQRQRIELGEVVRRTVDDYRSLFERSGVSLELTPAPCPVAVEADLARVAQIVGNLLQNAAKFTARGGLTRVTVSADTAGHRAVIAVADNGVGLAPETLARLFQPFVQAETTLDRSQGGLGLGLALVKGLVELHGGDISAHSAGRGAGAEFVVRLPLADRPPEEPSAGRVSVSRPKRRVLVVEDNVDAADSLREVLELSGHEVAVAFDGVEGLAKAREFRPEVVLCDIGLPRKDGYEVARALRSDPLFECTLLIALSGYALQEDLQRSAEAGFHHHLAKPPDLDRLEELLGSEVVKR